MRVLATLLLMGLPLGAVTLVEHGRTRHSIVVTAGAPAAEQRAGAELQRFLEEMTGAKLPLVTAANGRRVLLGSASGLDTKGLAAEEFILRTRGEDLLIAGGSPRGTLYGVYTLLDRFGCRWFTAEVSRIPKLETVRLPKLDERHKPAFEYREPFFTEAWDKDWAARNRTNGDHTRLDASTGGKLQYYPFVHTFEQLVPPAKYFATHPEYFSLIEGKRRAERSQLCLTNPDVLRIATEQVERWIVEHPEATIFSVSQNDWEGWCECDRCRKVEAEEGGEHSGPVLRFVNAVAEAIEAKHPDKLIDTLAYWYTENPPSKVRPRKNVRIRLCPIGICVAHSFAECPRSAYFYRNLQAWSKITNQLYIWHYNTDFSNYLMPFPDFDELAADVPLYSRLGVVGLFLQGAYAPGGGGDASELKAYVLARQLWDPAVKAEQAQAEFLEGVYGAAAPMMKAYYELLHGEVRGPAWRHLYVFNVPEYSKEFRGKAGRIFEEALRAAGDDKTRRRVLKARLPLEFWGLLEDAAFEVRDGSYGPNDPGALVERARAFYGKLREFGLQSIHEGQDLSKDEERLAEWRPRAVVNLERGGWQAQIVPELDGRVIRLSGPRGEVLRQPLSGENGYPAASGLYVTAHADWFGKAWETKWREVSRDGARLELEGVSEKGLRMRRIYEVGPEGLHVSTEAANHSEAALAVVLQERAVLDPGPIDEAGMAFRRVDGEDVAGVLLKQGEQASGKAVWLEGTRPAGRWRLWNGPEVRYETGKAARAVLSWSGKYRPGATFGLWTAERLLKPGEKVELGAWYGAQPAAERK